MIKGGTGGSNTLTGLPVPENTTEKDIIPSYQL